MILWYNITCEQRRRIDFDSPSSERRKLYLELLFHSTPKLISLQNHWISSDNLLGKKSQVKYRDLGSYPWAEGHIISVIWFIFRALGVPLQVSEPLQDPCPAPLSSSEVNPGGQAEQGVTETPRAEMSLSLCWVHSNLKPFQTQKPKEFWDLPGRREQNEFFRFLDAQNVCKHNVTCRISEPEFHQHHNKIQVI